MLFRTKQGHDFWPLLHSQTNVGEENVLIVETQQHRALAPHTTRTGPVQVNGVVSCVLGMSTLAFSHSHAIDPISLNHNDYGVCQACSTRRGTNTFSAT